MPGESLDIKGWTISTNKAPILGSKELEDVNAALGGVVNLPEQLYGHSWVDFHHQSSGMSVSFNAVDALRGWCKENKPPVRVEGAHEWIRSRRKELEASQADYLDYDWTFTSPYCGTTCYGREAAGERAYCLADSSPSRREAEEGWHATDAVIDRQMLMARDPLLLYDEVVLYESELDDNGVSNFSVKVRVMERCFYCLARFFLRVDNTMVRLREVRLFCRFDQPNQLLREVTHREGSMRELASAGAPGGAAFLDADSAGVALQAIAPVAVKLFLTEKLELPVGDNS